MPEYQAKIILAMVDQQIESAMGSVHVWQQEKTKGVWILMELMQNVKRIQTGRGHASAARRIASRSAASAAYEYARERMHLLINLKIIQSA